MLELENGDWVIFVSDGVLNAGIGGVYPLGWGWDQAAHFMEEHAHQDLNADDFAQKIADAVQELYVGAPGDEELGQRVGTGRRPLHQFQHGMRTGRGKLNIQGRIFFNKGNYRI